MAGPATLYQTGDHASRPANGSGCVLYSCTTHGLVYRDDGSSWSTFLTLPSAGASAAADVTFDPTGLTNTAATDVQEAIADLDGAIGAGSGALALIATQTVTGSDGTLTFSAIPATYTDLIILGRIRDDAAAVFTASPEMQVGNGAVDTGSNYEYAAYDSRVAADGLTTASASDTKLCYARSIIGDSATAGVYSPVEIMLLDYKSTTVFKTMMSRWGTHHATDPRHGQASGVWKNAGSAINIVTIKGVSGGNLKVGSSLRLYGRS